MRTCLQKAGAAAKAVISKAVERNNKAQHGLNSVKLISMDAETDADYFSNESEMPKPLLAARLCSFALLF